jgi:hypothetical protein
MIGTNESKKLATSIFKAKSKPSGKISPHSLKVEAAHFSEIFVSSYRIAQHYSPEDHNR